MKLINKNKKVKAYSLLELLVSLAIIAIATTVMINFLVISVKISVQSLARTFVREELSNSVVLISRDIRNSDKIISINCPTPGPTVTDCKIELAIQGKQYMWWKCPDGSAYRICKDTWNPVTSAYENTFKTSSSVNIDFIEIEYGYSAFTNLAEVNVLVTVSASHARPGLDIKNIIRQASVSTRNYEF